MGGCESYFGTADRSRDSSDVTTGKLKIKSKKVDHSVEQKPYLLNSYASQKLYQVDMQPLCVLPDGLDKSEWIASHTIVFFQHTNLLSSTLSEFCTARTCPIASGPGNMTFLWIDEYGKKVKCSGPLYTDYIMCYIQELLTDEEVFPTKPDASFPMGFTFLVQKIFLYLFHTLAHLYWAHFQEVVALEMYPHLNMVFAHFITFGREFQLLDQGDTQPLEDLISALSIEQNI